MDNKAKVWTKSGKNKQKMKSTIGLYQYTRTEVRRFVEKEPRQEGSLNKWELGKGWSAIKLREMRAQYTDNGKLIIQGKKEQREDFARRLKEHTSQERKMAEENTKERSIMAHTSKNETGTRWETENTRKGA